MKNIFKLIIIIVVVDLNVKINLKYLNAISCINWPIVRIDNIRIKFNF